MTQPTIFDVAERAGVSKSTVSKVLTQAPHVSGAARSKVESAIRELNYHPNVAARRFQSRRSRLLGLIMPRIGDAPMAPGFFSAFMLGAGAAAARHGYDLVWHVSMREDGTAPGAYARPYLQREVDGLLLTNTRLEDPHVTALQEAGCPFVIVGRYGDPSVYTVDVDNVAVGYLATRHLLELGHRRIGLLNGPAELPFCQDRSAGYGQALQEAGLTVDHTLVSWHRLREPEGHAATLQLFDAAPDLTALLVTDAALRAGCLRALHENGYAVPGRCSVVGVDDFLPEQEQPAFTVVVQPTAEMADAAVETVLGLLDGGAPADTCRLFTPHLVRGASTAPRTA